MRYVTFSASGKQVREWKGCAGEVKERKVIQVECLHSREKKIVISLLYNVCCLIGGLRNTMFLYCSDFSEALQGFLVHS